MPLAIQAVGESCIVARAHHWLPRVAGLMADAWDVSVQDSVQVVCSLPVPASTESAAVVVAAASQRQAAAAAVVHRITQWQHQRRHEARASDI
jgi:hypothetical protein